MNVRPYKHGLYINRHGDVEVWTEEDEKELLGRLEGEQLKDAAWQKAHEVKDLQEIDDPQVGIPSKAYDFEGDYRRQVLGE